MAVVRPPANELTVCESWSTCKICLTVMAEGKPGALPTPAMKTLIWYVPASRVGVVHVMVEEVTTLTLRQGTESSNTEAGLAKPLPVMVSRVFAEMVAGDVAETKGVREARA